MTIRNRYAVNVWCSNPRTADDCLTGTDFDDEAAARAGRDPGLDHGRDPGGELAPVLVGGAAVWMELTENGEIRAVRELARETTAHRRAAEVRRVLAFHDEFVAAVQDHSGYELGELGDASWPDALSDLRALVRSPGAKE